VEFPAPDMTLTRLLVVTDLERAKTWYRDVLGATVAGEYGGTSCVLRFLDSWFLLVTGGPPTSDKPTVTFAAPADPDRAAAELIIGVSNCHAAHEVLTSRGAQFLAPPVEYPWEVRAFFRDPDGHLFEISERRANR
jgi:catechol 2,3-dioxygenase-like lactoylglutathione lyase family enzyme